MFKSMVTAVVLCVVVSSTAISTLSLAQDLERGTTLVCVNEGGDALYVDEWPPEKVADFEAKSGLDVTELAVNPVTGDRTDYAGLVRGWFTGTSWLCALDETGHWRGPAWSLPMYRPNNTVLPDPATAKCPEPWIRMGEGRNELQRAATTAVHMTELEVAGDYDRLYDWMHPDSKAIVPQAAMEGWYREVFALRPPVWMTVDNVKLVEWTWDVTGKVYPSAAEVSFRQRFEDGQETEGVAHLVRDNGVWRWFFGADRAFINEQIARFPSSQSELDGGTPQSQATLPPDDATKKAAYTILGLGTGDGNWSSASYINNRGQILLITGTTNDPMSRLARDQRWMLWQDGTTTDLTSLGIGYVIAINDIGMVLATSMGRNLLYKAESGTLSPLPEFAYDAYPADINNAGILTGQVGASAVIVDAGHVHTIPIPSPFGFVGPAAINEAGHVAGTLRPSRTDESVQRGFFLANGELTILDAAPGSATLSSRATDLNDVGQVIGGPAIRGMHSIPEYGRAFFYDHGTGMTTEIGALPGFRNSIATAINNAGQAVGYSWLPEDWSPGDTTNQFRRAYLYDHQTGILADLNQLIPHDSGWYLTDAFDINDSGQIVGRGLTGGEMHAFLLTPTDTDAADRLAETTITTATSIPTATATAIPTPTALPTSRPSPTATSLSTPTIVIGPTPSPSPTVAATACQLVELYPGYPGYRGYVAGIDGPGEVACLADLVAANPGFDLAAEDAANLAAARAIGLAGSPIDWTWENWMAIEAERGLPATCYSCLFSDLDSLPRRQSEEWDVADPRLQMGGYGTSEAIVQAADGAGLGPNATAFFEDKFDPNDQDSLGPDHDLRAFVGLSLPGHHTAPEMVDAYDELFALLAGEGTTFFDAGLMWDTVLAQGGYAPTPPAASVEDQLYMVRTSLEAMCYTGPQETCDWYLGLWYDQIIEPGYLGEVRTSGQDISLRDWLREEFGNPLRDQ